MTSKGFNRFWTYASPTWAGKFFDDWYRRAMSTKIEPIKTTAKSLRKHKTLLASWLLGKKNRTAAWRIAKGGASALGTRNVAFGWRGCKGWISRRSPARRSPKVLRRGQRNRSCRGRTWSNRGLDQLSNSNPNWYLIKRPRLVPFQALKYRHVLRH